MKSCLKIALALGAAIGAGGLFAAVNADAQQAGPPPIPNPPPAAAAPGATMPPAQNSAQPRFSAQDRAAFFDARLAAIRAGLELTPDQQNLWGPVEAAVRGLVKARQDARQTAMTQGRPKDPIDALNRAADAATARGTALHNLATAAAPLYASLTPDQKRLLPVLMRGGGGMGRNRRMGMGGRMGMGDAMNNDRTAMRDRMMEMMRRFRQGQGGADGNQGQDGRGNQYNRNYNRDGATND